MSAAAIGTQSRAGKFWYLVVMALVLALDQFTKYWVSLTLRNGGDIEVIPGFLTLSYTENPGIAFGMLSNGNVRWLLVAVSVAAVVIVAYYMARTHASNRLLLWSLSLLAAGIVGNLIDRVHMGRVIDFIEAYYKSYHWPVFNVADTAITIGAALMAIELFVSPQAERATATERNESPVKDSSIIEPMNDGM
jgi:signal peptidase II